MSSLSYHPVRQHQIEMAYVMNDHADYIQRMENSRQFTSFNIDPQWVPGVKDIKGFVHDEVVRQGHDPRIRTDGGVRVEWMLAAWEYAQRAATEGGPTINDILAMGTLVEPHHNSAIGFRTMNVYIGDSMGAHPAKLKEFVPVLLTQVNVEPVQERIGPHPDEYRSNWDKFEELVQQIKTADDWYLAYEAIHPFADGNGRTGKILHNWLMHTLDDPVLVADYFEGGNP